MVKGLNYDTSASYARYLEHCLTILNVKPFQMKSVGNWISSYGALRAFIFGMQCQIGENLYQQPDHSSSHTFFSLATFSHFFFMEQQIKKHAITLSSHLRSYYFNVMVPEQSTWISVSTRIHFFYSILCFRAFFIICLSCISQVFTLCD